jgi:hypothetical protein
LPGGLGDATLGVVERKMNPKLTVLALLAVGFAVFVMLAGGSGQSIQPFPAPALSPDPARWLNSAPLKLGDGRVYLVELWSYG